MGDTANVEQVLAYLQNRERWRAEELEELADFLLAATLKNRARTKSRREEYPVLSARQFQRRLRVEIPFTALSRTARLALGLTVADEEPH